MSTNPGKTHADAGLTRLDGDRAQSMADEGGASAATVEAAAPPETARAPRASGPPRRGKHGPAPPGPGPTRPKTMKEDEIEEAT